MLCHAILRESFLNAMPSKRTASQAEVQYQLPRMPESGAVWTIHCSKARSDLVTIAVSPILCQRGWDQLFDRLCFSAAMPPIDVRALGLM